MELYFLYIDNSMAINIFHIKISTVQLPFRSKTETITEQSEQWKLHGEP